MEVSIIVLILLCSTTAQEYEFPEGFQFGVATASYQVEGAWNVSGKGENIWDRLTHSRSELITDKSNGDIACDTYHKTDEDVQLLSELGVNFYRFSISWSRILPNGRTNHINADGIRYYNELIDALLENNIAPFVTMYHWDLPQVLQEIGGWTNPLLADLFAEYADILYSNFGDRVKNWITFNEPMLICEFGYSSGEMAPAYTQSGIGGYLCAHTLLIAHAKAYRVYKENYKRNQKGKVGITCQTSWFESQSDSQDDKEASENALQMTYGWYVHPILSPSGDYPPVMRRRIDALSENEGFSKSRLPRFTSEEIQLIRGSADFLGLNHYTSEICTKLQGDISGPSYYVDVGSNCRPDPTWETSASSWLYVVPWGIRKLLVWIKNEYDNVEVIITENGFSDTGVLNDCRRVNYYNSYLTEVLKAIHEDKCNVIGYIAWSFMDNFEWVKGYTERFGINHVDFDDPHRKRTPKMSSYVLKNIIATRKIDWDYTPEGFDPCEWDKRD